MEKQICNKCKVEKYVLEFHRNVKSKNGYLCICKECRKKPCSEYYQNNKQQSNESKKTCRQKNINHYRAIQRKRRAERKEELNAANRLKRILNPQFRVRENMSRRMNYSLHARNLTKNKISWIELVGYDLQELKAHLEKQFTKEMSWENYGSYWHIDHIKPDSRFIYESVEDIEFKKCWALSNLQPLKAEDNLKKSNKWNG